MPTALERQTALVRAMTPAERVRRSEDLYRAAWELKAAFLRARFPALPEQDVQDQVRRIFRDTTR